MKKIYLFTSLVLAIFLLSGAVAKAQINTLSAGTTWEGGTWSQGHMPTSSEDALINTGLTVTINSAAVCQSLTLNGGATATTVTINGASYSLTVTNAIYINAPTAAVNKTLAVGAGTLTAGSITITAGTTSNYISQLTVSTGTVNCSGNITFGGTAAYAKLQFTGAGTLNIGGNLGTGGTFTASTGTVNYNGSSSQTIGSYTYYNLILSGSDIKTLAAATNIGALTVNAGATLNLSNFNLESPKSTTLYCGASTGSTISGTGTLTLGGPVTVMYAGTGNSGATISCPVALGAIRTFTVADDGSSAADLTVSGSIGGTGFGFNKEGLGTMVLSGSSTSYTGATTVSAGTLKLGSATALGSSSMTTVNSGAVLDLSGITLSTQRALTLNGIGLTASPAGALTNTGGDASYSGAITLGSSGATINATQSGTLTVSGLIGGNTFPLILDGSGTGTISNVIGTGSGTVTKNGIGTWTLSELNTYSGNTLVSAGTLKLGAAGDATHTPLGTTGSGTTVSSGAVLDLGGFTLGTAEALTLNGTGISDGGALTNSSAAAASYSGLITLGSASSIVANTGDINISNPGTITGESFGLTLGGSGNGSLASVIGTGSGTLTKSGTGTWILSGSSSYTGLTEITEGTLKLGSEGGTDNTPLGTVAAGTIVSSGAALDLNGYTLGTEDALTLNGTGISSGGALMNSGDPAIYNGVITLETSSSIGTGPSGDIALSYGIIAADKELSKVGEGTLTLGIGETSLAAINIEGGGFNIPPDGQVTLANSLTVATGATFTLQSDGVNNEAMLLFNSGTTQTGDATVELYLTGNLVAPEVGSFHYIVPPVQSMTIGTTITEVATALGLSNFNGDLLRYIEPNAVADKEAGWQYFDNYPGSLPGFSILTPDRGYDIYLTNDDKIKFKGQLNANAHTFNLSYTSGNPAPGWNLVGNPYPVNYSLSGIDALSSADEDGVGNTVYYTYNGEFVYYNVYTEEGGGPSTPTEIIRPMQGFFVYVTETGKSLSLPEGLKTFSTAQPRLKGMGNSDNNKASQNKKARLLLTSGSESDETILFLVNGSTDDFNEIYDGFKLFSSNNKKPSIYSNLKGVNYFMKAVGYPDTDPVTVPLELIIKESGSQTINIIEFENLSDFKVMLKHGNVEIPVALGTSYSFNSEAGTYKDFQLIFEKISTDIEPVELSTLKTWYSNNYLYMNFPGDIQSGKGKLVIYDFNGKPVYLENNLQVVPEQTIQIPVNFQKGLYFADLVIDVRHYKSKIVVY